MIFVPCKIMLEQSSNSSSDALLYKRANNLFKPLCPSVSPSRVELTLLKHLKNDRSLKLVWSSLSRYARTSTVVVRPFGWYEILSHDSKTICKSYVLAWFVFLTKWSARLSMNGSEMPTLSPDNPHTIARESRGWQYCTYGSNVDCSISVS